MRKQSKEEVCFFVFLWKKKPPAFFLQAKDFFVVGDGAELVSVPGQAKPAKKKWVFKVFSHGVDAKRRLLARRAKDPSTL